MLKSSYFAFKNEYYQQISSCAIGLPIIPTIANLVMEYVEAITLTTVPSSPRWWFRTADDSHAGLKRKYVKEFHEHINSINEQMQFTIFGYCNN